MDPRCRIELFGWLRVQREERVIARFQTRQTGALLAYLAFFRQRAHDRAVLSEILWPEDSGSTDRHKLRKALTSLRRQLEPPGVPAGSVIFADRSSVQLNPAVVTTDVGEFEAALEAARTGSSLERPLLLARAVELYRGELLPGFYEEWILPERQRLAEAYLQALVGLVGHLEETRDFPRALEYARRAVTADPLRDESHRALMRLLAAAGQPEAALLQYRELTRLLAEELGEEPCPETRQLARRIEVRPLACDADQADARETEVPVQAAGTSSVSAASPTPAPGLMGTVTFLLTDIEGSTALWEKTGEEFRAALNHHHVLLRREFRRHGGAEVREAGDSFIVAFAGAGQALACAVAAQQALSADMAGVPLRVRMALHTGDVELEEDGCHDLVLHHASRILAAGHGGQILCSEVTAGLLRRGVPARPNGYPLTGTTAAEVRLVDLGIYRLRDVALPERLFQVTYPDMDSAEFPPLKAELGFPSHLPLQFTRFFGRKEEIARLREMLGQTADGSGDGPARRGRRVPSPACRLVTLTGPGGSGKTRLALEVAGRMVDALHGAVWFVPLADMDNPGRIVEAVLEALRLPHTPHAEPLESVAEFLSGQAALLVLDNFEHLVGEGAPVVRTLLERAPALQCLVTSRQRLGLEGEREFPVLPLPTPDRREGPERLTLYESVQLFVDRAQAVLPDFQVTNSNAAAVAALCRRLEGIPLALELAAARVRSLTPGQMLEHLEHRLDFLASGRRDVPARHRTLRAAIDWSYRLLAPELREFFARLSVFRGGWTLEAAEAVCEKPSALDCLAQLQECSLVERVRDQTRFRMLEALREFALERLKRSGEADVLHQRHAQFYLELAEEAAPVLRGSDLQERPAAALRWLERLEGEHDNLRVALGWLAESGSVDAAVRLGSALWGFWYQQGYWTEGRERLTALVALPGARQRTPAWLNALHMAGSFAFQQGEFETARRFWGEWLAIQRALDNKQSVAEALNNLGLAASGQGDYAAASALLEESVAIERELGDRSRVAVGLDNLGVVARAQGDYGGAEAFHRESLRVTREGGQPQEIVLALLSLGITALLRGDCRGAQALYTESLQIAREVADKYGITRSLEGLGDVARAERDYTTARSLYADSLTVRRELGNKEGIAGSLADLGLVALLDGDDQAGRTLLKESLIVNQELGNRRGVARGLEAVAGLAAAQGQAERAAHLFGAAEAIREAIRAPLPHADQARHDRAVAAARTALGEQAFATARTRGRSMTLAEAISCALD